MSPRLHFLVLTFPLQGHIAPALRLARRLLATVPDALVTFSTTAVAHRRMFPTKSEGPDDDDDRLEFLPFSDGTESGYVRTGESSAFNDYRRRDPSFVVQLPGLPPLAVGDLPSFLTDSADPSDYFHSIYTTFRDLFDTLDRDTPKATVLINTCQELEASALAAVGAYDVLPIGPVLPSGDEAGLFKQDDARYMEWLDAKPANSVVYVSFGNLARMAREQLDELLRGLEESGRPYLCVVRKDNKTELAEAEAEIDAGLKNGMMVEWCDQVRVLSHTAVGCFVTHCGWNSVLESVACGVPMVCVPRMSDQRMNARLVECEWRVGAPAEVDGSGVLRAAEVRRRIEEAMGEGEAAVR